MQQLGFNADQVQAELDKATAAAAADEAAAETSAAGAARRANRCATLARESRIYGDSYAAIGPGLNE